MYGQGLGLSISVFGQDYYAVTGVFGDQPWCPPGKAFRGVPTPVGRSVSVKGLRGGERASRILCIFWMIKKGCMRCCGKPMDLAFERTLFRYLPEMVQ